MLLKTNIQQINSQIFADDYNGNNCATKCCLHLTCKNITKVLNWLPVKAKCRNSIIRYSKVDQPILTSIQTTLEYKK